jgi:hypothetical protein
LTSVQTIEESEAFVIRVDAGTSDTKVRRFRPGVPVATLTVGSQGAWKVEAPGVASVHAYLRFDGSQLLVATSDPRRPVMIDGTAAPETWSPLHPPCRLGLGQASLSVERSGTALTPPSPVFAASPVRCGDDEEPTRHISVPAAAPTWQQAHDESAEADLPPAEPTRLQFGHLEPPPQGTRAVQVSSLPPTLLDGSPAGEGELDARGSLPPLPLTSDLKTPFQRGIRTGGAVLALVLVVGGVYRLASPRNEAIPRPNGPPAKSDVHAAAPLTAPPATIATGSPPVIGPSPFVPAPEPGLAGSAPGLRGQTTTERRAADAFGAGDFPTALRLYRELAAARPDQPAFRQAVKILEEK